jgi:NAD(P)-dependent dehydrogenase (short-subunit alcohol dehydrogenase family)
MSSAYWDEKLAERLKKFRFDFPPRALAGRVIVVAGGTGGLGAATTALLAQEGARLVVGYRSNRARAEALVRAIEEQYRHTPALVEGDIAKPAVRQAFLDAAAKLGALSGAAIFPGDPARVKTQEVDAAAIEASMRSNYTGAVLLARDLGAAMEAGGDGSIVLLSTMQGVGVFAGSLAYAAPKAALVHAARILSLEWKNVRVNVVAPGATVAGMAESSVKSGKYDQVIATGAVPRFGRPEDVARAVRFFLEPDSYLNGQVLVVDGGLTLRRHR